MKDAAALSDAKRQLLEKMLRGGGGRPAPIAPVQRRGAGAIVPISAAQRQVWLHASMAPDVPLYNESITIHRKGAFSLAAMAASLNEILRRHESWRTGFELLGGELVQVVRDEARIDLPIEDVSHLPEAERDAAALAIGSEDARRAIPLAEAPLLRARVVKLGEEDHRLYLTLHHIIFDGVSIYRVVVPELAALYEAYSKGLPSPLPEPALQYGDYALWEKAMRGGAALERQLLYWREALADAPAKLELAGDRARPAEPTHAGSMETFTIPAGLTERLKTFSRARGATLYMTLLAAFKAMLHRYSGEEDLIVGGVTDLRRRPELEPLVGYFLNTIALRSRPRAEMPFAAYLDDVRETVLGALGASEMPFDEVVRALKVKRPPGSHPLFNILFSIEPPVDPFPDGWDLTQMDVVVGAAKFDLYLELDERPEGMIGRFLYSKELFDVATIRRMIGHWLTLLEHVVADPGCRLGDLPLLTRAEEEEMAGWNRTARLFPATSLAEAIAAHARSQPDRLAIVAGERRWTYAELRDRAERLAGALRGIGVGKGSLVAIGAGRSPEMVAGLIAILKAGAAYLPLDPSFPRARLDHIVADGRPDALLTEKGHDGLFPCDGLPILFADDPDLPDAPADLPAPAGEDLAYVLYTSGSTGKPKGVEVPHRALLNLLFSMRDDPGFSERDSLLAVTTLAFDIAALEIFLPLLCGGRLILAAREAAADPGALATLIAAERPTVMQATPATWRALVEAGWSGDERLTILCGGEALPRALADDLIARSGAVWNMYGPTETTIWSTVHKVARGDGPVPIGRPIANTLVHVLDREGNKAPAGCVGELFIGGAGVARGYRGRPDLTAERFGEWAAAPGTFLYRTGDLARWRADGSLLCLGRTDSDEKIRGFRVAVEEVEGALAAHPAIVAAAVRGWPDASGERALAAYLVPRDGEALSAAALRDHLKPILPDYMIPSRFEILAALPMTPNGKVDRKALPAPSGDRAPALAPPQGEAEERLAALWREILGIEQVGRHDSFFDLGGHSLLVAKLLRRLELDYGRKLSLAHLFRAHSLEAMTTLLDAGTELPSSRAVPIQPNGWRPPLLWLEAGPTFLPLSKSLGSDQPFLGVPIESIFDAGTDADFADYAAAIVALIREIRPHGPYYLGGWCTSGILAYEVAAQLRAAGEPVPLLLLAHAMNPAALRRIGGRRIAASKLSYHGAQFLRMSGTQRWRYLDERIKGVWEKVSGADEGPNAARGAQRIALDRAAWLYDPPLYDGDVALFQPAERPRILDSRPGWERIVRGRLVAHEIAGGHSTMLEPPYVEELGAAMRDALVRAQAAHDARDSEPLRAAG
ncbi:MAG TPA: amino acid adenylation domain-containing protein [Allosphingosinicella sp.]|nr:amino acid adenylation domain-containing protein [Allosphingosinicella sp.]